MAIAKTSYECEMCGLVFQSRVEATVEIVEKVNKFLNSVKPTTEEKEEQQPTNIIRTRPRKKSVVRRFK